MADWIWALVGVAVTLSVTAAVILWYAFKHLDDKMDRKFDQVMAGIAETKQLVAGHAERINISARTMSPLTTVSGVALGSLFGASNPPDSSI